MKKLLLWEQCDEERLQLLRDNLTTDWTIRGRTQDDSRDALAAELASADAMLSMRWDHSMLPAPQLGLLQLPGAGLDQIDFAVLPAQCAVCNVYEHEIGIAEYIVLGILEWEIALRSMDANLKKGRWCDGWATGAPLHGELYGKTVGFVGYGRIARETAKRLRSFGVTNIARTRSPEKGDEWVDEIAGMDDLNGMLSRCDFLVVTCPLTDQTRGLIGRDAYARMKNDSVVVNIARGEVLVEEDLYAACRDGTIGGAVIDTWYRYPGADYAESTPCFPSAYPFQELDNVIMTPHASGWSAGLMKRRWKVIGENLDRLARGEPLLNRVTENA